MHAKCFRLFVAVFAVIASILGASWIFSDGGVFHSALGLVVFALSIWLSVNLLSPLPHGASSSSSDSAPSDPPSASP